MLFTAFNFYPLDNAQPIGFPNTVVFHWIVIYPVNSSNHCLQ